MSIAEAAPSLRELAENSNAWPFEEARKIVARLKRKPKDEVIFETGYGPSGLPHIGTFGEVARTTMVRHAFRVLTDDKVKTRLIAFSDDMDGLREGRAQTYSPFLPIHPTTGIVMQVPVETNAGNGTITWSDPETNERFETPVIGGRAKLQWKPDWAMRWIALGIDYEMAGKDLIDSVKLSGEICRALGGTPPEGFNYELFLDERGQKMSKSKGNGLTIEEWLRYASPESLSLFMYREPKAAKRLY